MSEGARPATEEQEEIEEFAVPQPERFIAFAHSGDVVFLECSISWSQAQVQAIEAQIANALQGTGVNAVLLPVGIRVARVELEGS